MNAIPYDTPEQDWDPTEEHEIELPGRPRRRFWGPGSAVLLALLVGVVGFYIGIRVEKGQLSNSAGTVSSAIASRLAGRTGAGAGAAAGTGAGGSARSEAGGFGRALAGGAGGSGATFGSVSSVKGNTIYLTDISGNTVKVRLSSATKVTKNKSVSKSEVRPGDTLIVQGLKGSGGTIEAASVSDSGPRSTAFGGGGGGGGASSSGGSGGGGSGSASSAINSLFGSGGGGSGGGGSGGGG